MFIHKSLTAKNDEHHPKPKTRRRLGTNQQDGSVGGRRQENRSGRRNLHAGDWAS